MHKLNFTKQAGDTLQFLSSSSPEIAKLIATQIEKRCKDPDLYKSSKIIGYPVYRARVGSYRIIYEYEGDEVLVTVIEKRDRVFEQLRKLNS